MKQAKQQYNNDFYKMEGTAALSAAEIILPYVLNQLNCKSVVDFGCGTGEWLRVAKNVDPNLEILGLDGNYAKGHLVIEPEEFMGVDLREEISLKRKYDLVMSLEVAEHLPESSAETFINNLVRHADMILFSAAVPHQGGIGHINEQYPSYWRTLFEKNGYEICDCVGQRFWNDKRIPIFYRQNILLYGKRELADSIKRRLSVDYPIFDAIHPGLYEAVYQAAYNREEYIFPFDQVERGSKVVVYGAGAVGKEFVKQLHGIKYAKLVLWCDRGTSRDSEMGLHIENYHEIIGCEYDSVVIAIKSETTAEEIRSQLRSINVPAEKILWNNPVLKAVPNGSLADGEDRL